MAPTSESPGRDGNAERAAPSADEIRDQLERILASPALRGSSRRRDLLRYLVEETLAGRAGHLKGYNVALAVFGRPEDFDAGGDPVVRLEAHRLRRDLDSYYVDAGTPDPVRIIVPKGGYVPRFEWQRAGPAIAPDPPASNAPPNAPVIEPDGTAPAGTPSRGRLRWLSASVAMATMAVLTAAAGAWFWFGSASPIKEARGPSIIVLPFETLSSRDDDQFLAAGVTQELITNLMRFDDLRLYSVPASFRQDGDADPVTLGHDLGVGYVVKGSVASDATVVRVTAQLFTADTGSVIWSGTYDQPPTRGALLAARAEIASSIATVLGQTYGVVHTDMDAQLASGDGPSMTSYACVLKANAYRRTLRDELRQPVLDCLEAAVARDPDYAEPWALLGWLHLDAARYGFVPDAEIPTEMGTALGFASRAIAVDPENVVALRALSAVQYHLGNFDESERIQRQALALNPNDPDTLAQLAWRLSYRGRWEEGLAYSERAIARTIDPPGWYYDPKTIHFYLEGRYREMLASAKHTAAGDSQGVAFLAIAYGALGDHAAAQEALATMAKQAPDFARDPATAFRRFLPLESIVEALMDGLRKAGWKDPAAAPTL